MIISIGFLDQLFIKCLSGYVKYFKWRRMQCTRQVEAFPLSTLNTYAYTLTVILYVNIYYVSTNYVSTQS